MAGSVPDFSSIAAKAVFLSYASQDAEAARKICDGLRAAGLVDVEVRERLVYDLDQLGAFFGSELDSGACGCTTTVASARLRQLALPMVGKIWSARVFARKPA